MSKILRLLATPRSHEINTVKALRLADAYESEQLVRAVGKQQKQYVEAEIGQEHEAQVDGDDDEYDGDEIVERTNERVDRAGGGRLVQLVAVAGPHLVQLLAVPDPEVFDDVLVVGVGFVQAGDQRLDLGPRLNQVRGAFVQLARLPANL